MILLYDAKKYYNFCNSVSIENRIHVHVTFFFTQNNLPSNLSKFVTLVLNHSIHIMNVYTKYYIFSIQHIARNNYNLIIFPPDHDRHLETTRTRFASRDNEV